MRVVTQLIDHLRETGHLSATQLAQLRTLGLFNDAVPVPEGEWRDYDPYWSDDGWTADEDSQRNDDVWDMHGDKLIDIARNDAAGRRAGGRRRRTPDVLAKTIAALEDAIIGSDEFGRFVQKIALRMDGTIKPGDAYRAVGTADAAELDASLVRDSLWARIWPYVVTEPVVSALDEPERRRFCQLFGPDGSAREPLPVRLSRSDVVRTALDIVRAHRVLSAAFDRVVFRVDAARAFHQLNLSGDPIAYETLIILHSARIGRLTVRDLPRLPLGVGLPMPQWLRDPAYRASWDIAARIDPIVVLPFMEWCVNAWAELGHTYRHHLFGPERLTVGAVDYLGNWVSGACDEWFSLDHVGGQWNRQRFTRHDDVPVGVVSQRLTRNDVEYLHVCPAPDCPPVKRFRRHDDTEEILVQWSTEHRSRRMWTAKPGEYGRMWVARLNDMPVLTCPKEWELT